MRITPLLQSPGALSRTIYFRRLSESGHGSGGVERARSTAEEFERQAKEKAESVAQGAKETLEDAKESVLGSGDSSKANPAHAAAKDKKFKDKVEKGKYNKIGEE